MKMSIDFSKDLQAHFVEDSAVIMLEDFVVVLGKWILQLTHNVLYINCVQNCLIIWLSKNTQEVFVRKTHKNISKIIIEGDKHKSNY